MNAIQSRTDLVLVSGHDVDTVDERLRQLCRTSDVGQRAIAFYLAELHDRGLHQSLSRPTLVSYAVHDLGLARRTARELVQAGLSLRELPAIDEAFRDGRLSWSKTRRLCVVATPDTETDWLARALRCTQDELRRLVQRVRRGDAPPAADSGLPRSRFAVRVELDALQWQVFEQARAKLRAELDADDDLRDADLLLEMARLVLQSDAEGRVPGRSRVDGSLYKVLVREAADAAPEPSPAAIATDDGDEPLAAADAEPALSDAATPPWLRAKVFARDDHACRACGSRRSLHAHHVVFRSRGGATALDNLVTLCARCHGLVHAGLLLVEAVADARAAPGAGRRATFGFQDGLGRQLRRHVLAGPRVRVEAAPGWRHAPPGKGGGGAGTTAGLDAKWLAQHLDQFETLGGRLVLKAQFRDSVVGAVGIAGLGDGTLRVRRPE